MMPGEWDLMNGNPKIQAGAQDVSGIPANDTMAKLEMQRRLRMAQALQDQKMPEGQMVSGHYVAPSWTQYAANLANEYVGGKKEQEAIKQYSDYETAKQAKIGKLVDELQRGKEISTTDNTPYQIQIPNGQASQTENLGGMQPVQNGMKTIDVPMTNTSTSYKPYSQQEYMAKVLQAMPELAPKMLETQFANKFKENAPIKGSAGDVFFDPVTHQKIFSVPSKPDHTTLSDIGKLTSELQDIQNANPNDPRIPSYRDAIKKASTFAPPMQVVSMPQPQVAINPRTNQPELVQFPNKPGMKPQFTGISPYEKPKDLNEAQSNANLFGTRADKANKELNALEGQYSPAKIQAQNFVAGVPGASYIANKAMSDKDQQASQAQMDFVTAVLRKESGASISPSEFENARRQYFPQPGDTPAVMKQKAANRQTAITGIMGASGASNKPSGKVVVDY